MCFTPPAGIVFARDLEGARPRGAVDLTGQTAIRRVDQEAERRLSSKNRAAPFDWIVKVNIVVDPLLQPELAPEHCWQRIHRVHRVSGAIVQQTRSRTSGARLWRERPRGVLEYASAPMT
jgi:hypothetical protein